MSYFNPDGSISPTLVTFIICGLVIVVLQIIMSYVDRRAERIRWKTRSDWLWSWTARADDRPIFKEFRFNRTHPIHRTTTGTYANMVDLIMCRYAWLDWKSTLNARLVSPRYMYHPNVKRALNYVPPRVALDQTFGYVIWWLRKESCKDPDNLVEVLVHDDILFSRIALSYGTLSAHRIVSNGKYHDNNQIAQRLEYDVSDDHIPRLEAHGPGTLDLFCVTTQCWETINFRLFVHPGEVPPPYKIMSARKGYLNGWTMLVQVVAFPWDPDRLTRPDDFCILDLMTEPNDDDDEDAEGS